MDIFFIAILIILSFFGTIAYFIVLNIFFDKRTAKIEKILNEKRTRSFWVGFINFGFFGVVSLSIFAIAQDNGIELLNFIAFIIVLLLLIGVSLGLVPVIKIIGSNVWGNTNELLQMTFGTLAFLLASAFPIIGWFFLLPFVMFISFGGFILSLFGYSTIRKEDEKNVLG